MDGASPQTLFHSWDGEAESGVRDGHCTVGRLRGWQVSAPLSGVCGWLQIIRHILQAQEELEVGVETKVGICHSTILL